MASIVRYILDDLANSLGRLDFVKAAIVLGSVARGEESYVLRGDEFVLNSDVELLIVTSTFCVSRDHRLLIEQCVAAVQSRFSAKCGRSFRIDFSIIARWRLRFLDRRFIHFETKSLGEVIVGSANIVDLIPDITSNNLNYSELHSVLVHRAYAMFKASRTHGKEVGDEEYLTRVICRNALDLLSVLLPHCGALLAGYSARHSMTKRMVENEMREIFFDPHSFVDFLELCLRVKLGSASEHELAGSSPGELLNRFFAYIDEIQAFVTRQQPQRFFRVDPRRLVAAAIRLKPHCLLIELNRGRLERELFCELRAALMDLEDGQPGAKMSTFQPRMKELYPSVY